MTNTTHMSFQNKTPFLLITTWLHECSYVPETPFSVKIRSGLRRIMSSQICWMYSSSICRMRAKSSSRVISISVWEEQEAKGQFSMFLNKPSEEDCGFRQHLTWLSPFLYSREQSSRTILGFLMSLRIRGWVTSLFTITPLSTQESSMMPPGTCSHKHHN